MSNIISTTRYRGYTITVKPNIINVSTMSDDGYLRSHSYIGYDIDDIKNIIDDELEEEKDK